MTSAAYNPTTWATWRVIAGTSWPGTTTARTGVPSASTASGPAHPPAPASPLVTSPAAPSPPSSPADSAATTTAPPPTGPAKAKSSSASRPPMSRPSPGTESLRNSAPVAAGSSLAPGHGPDSPPPSAASTPRSKSSAHPDWPPHAVTSPPATPTPHSCVRDSARDRPAGDVWTAPGPGPRSARSRAAAPRSPPLRATAAA